MHKSEDFSNALCIAVESIEQTSNGCYKITDQSGSIFFARQFYLQDLVLEDLYSGLVLDEQLSNELVDSTLDVATELQAMNYLNRSEHSRFLLSQKLMNKGHSKSSIEKVLDYLESVNYLSDYRFSIAWLRTRRLSNSEGRTKLYGELLSRGINSKVANQALDEFFQEFPEEDLLEKALEKLIRQGCPKEKITEKLIKKGFALSEIKKKC